MVRVFPFDHPEAATPYAHLITAREGAAMCRAYKESPISSQDPIRWNSITFHAKSIQILLEQDGVEGIMWQLALNEGATTLVGFGVNRLGHVVGDLAIEAGQPCPPFC